MKCPILNHKGYLTFVRNSSTGNTRTSSQIIYLINKYRAASSRLLIYHVINVTVPVTSVNKV